MENASNALIIAGEVLIAILVISLFTTFIGLFGNFSKNINGKMEQQEVTKYNANFQSFSGRYDITANEIASIINFAEESNVSHDLDIKNTENAYYTNVFIEDKEFIDFLKITKEPSKSEFNNYLNDWIKGNYKNYYSCNCKISKDGKYTASSNDIEIGEFGKIKSITFHKIEAYDTRYRKEEISLDDNKRIVLKNS